MATLTKCPECGGTLQATVVLKQWLTWSDGAWEAAYDEENGSIEEVQFYCADDCTLTPEQIAAFPEVPSAVLRLLLEGRDPCTGDVAATGS